MTLGMWTGASAQSEMTKEEYIAAYAPLAMRHQREYGIPASITMAQGLLESRYGNSDLSRRSNNHFGIKCKKDWVGDTVRYDDDARQECFRRYSSVEDSYRDHSEFLRNSPRYERLFSLDPKDYKGWARGLKECGYATAPHYAAALIKYIEDYELYLLDDGELPSYLAGVTPLPQVALPAVDQSAPSLSSIDIDDCRIAVFSLGGYGVFADGGGRYVVAAAGDTFGSIADAVGIGERRLVRYNRKHLGRKNLLPGDTVYLERPRS